MSERRTTRKKPEPVIPGRFTPLFWKQADSRLAIVKEIQGRYDDLKADTGADSVQRDILVQRAVFLTVWIETAERKAIDEGVFDPGPYVQAVNSLLGLLKTLGLERHAKKVATLQTYVEGKR